MSQPSTPRNECAHCGSPMGVGIRFCYSCGSSSSQSEAPLTAGRTHSGVAPAHGRSAAQAATKGEGWYVARVGLAPFGPYPWEQIVDFARGGRIGPNDHLWSAGYSAWITAGSVTGLLPTSQPVVIYPQTAASTDGRAPGRGRRFPWGLAALGALLLVLLCGVGAFLVLSGSVDLSLPTTEARAISPRHWQSTPVPHADYVSAPIHITPIAGVSIQAPAGALDQPRSFKVRPASGRPLREAQTLLKEIGAGLAAAYDVDAGMKADDRLRQPVTVTFDMDELGVDPDFWPHTHLFTIADKQLVPLATSRSGSQLVWTTPHNGIVLVIVAGTAVFGASFGGASYVQENIEEFDGKKWTGAESSGKHFLILWSEDMSRQGPVCGEVYARLKHMWHEFHYAGSPPPAPAPGVPAQFTSLNAYKQHLRQGILELEAKVNDADWQKETCTPPAAYMVDDALEFAYNYLTNVRGFSPPGHKIKVYMRKPWPARLSRPGATTYGMVSERRTSHPYLNLNFSLFPLDVERLEDLSSQQRANLEITVVHELFHIFQASYGPSGFRDINVYTVGEATALALEREIWPHYAGRLGDQSAFESNLTARRDMWYVYLGPLEISTSILDRLGWGKGPAELSDLGYGLSHFFEYVRQQTAPGDTRFLNRFYASYSAGNGLAASLNSAAGSTNLTSMFQSFAVANAENLRTAFTTNPGRVPGGSVTLLPSRPEKKWKGEEIPPLSSPLYQITVPATARDSEKAFAVVMSGDAPAVVRLRYSGGRPGDAWSDIGSPTQVISPTVFGDTTRRFMLQAIGTYMPSDAAPPGSFEVVMLFPTAGVRLSPTSSVDIDSLEEDAELEVRWVRSGLSARDDFAYNLRVETWVDGQRKAEFEEEVARNVTAYKVPFASLLPGGSPHAEGYDGGDAIELRVIVCELLKAGDDQIKGPPSDEVVLLIVSENLAGEWEGKIVIDDAGLLINLIEGFLTTFVQSMSPETGTEEIRAAVRSSIEMAELEASFRMFLTLQPGQPGRYQIRFVSEDGEEVIGTASYLSQSLLGRIAGAKPPPKEFVTTLVWRDGSSSAMRGDLVGSDRLSGTFSINVWGFIPNALKGSWRAVRVAR